MAVDVRALSAGSLVARFAPDAGMVGVSLRHHRRELLGQRGGIDAYMSRGSTFGIPLLHPWANRLGGFTYEAAGRAVAIDASSPLVRTEEHGLPIHGLLHAWRGWRVLDDGERALTAEMAFDDPALLAAFPFAHTLRHDIALEPGRLTIATTLTPTGGPVPVAFGFHPYFALPQVAREDVVLRAPPMTHLALDDRGLPTGEGAPGPARDGALGDTTYDDLFTGVGDGTGVTLEGGGRAVTLRLLEGYTHLQLFAPPGGDVIAVEPMTAPTDALRTGDGLRIVEQPFRAAFAIEVADQA